MKKIYLLLIVFVQVFCLHLVIGQSLNQDGLGKIRDYSHDPKYEGYSNDDIFNDIFMMGSASCSLESKNGKTIFKPNSDYHYSFHVYRGGKFEAFLILECSNFGGIIQFSRNGEFFLNYYNERDGVEWEKKGDEFCENENILFNNLFGSLSSGGMYVYHPIMERTEMYKSNIELIDKSGNVFLWHCSEQMHYLKDPIQESINLHDLIQEPIEPIMDLGVAEMEGKGLFSKALWIIKLFPIFILLLFCIFIISCFFLFRIFNHLGKKWWEAFIPVKNLYVLLDVVCVYKVEFIWVVLTILWLLGFGFFGGYELFGKDIEINYKKIIGWIPCLILILEREYFLFKAYYRLFRKYNWNKIFSVVGTIFFPIGACILGFGNFQVKRNELDEKEDN